MYKITKNDGSKPTRKERRYFKRLRKFIDANWDHIEAETLEAIQKHHFYNSHHEIDAKNTRGVSPLMHILQNPTDPPPVGKM